MAREGVRRFRVRRSCRGAQRGDESGVPRMQKENRKLPKSEKHTQADYLQYSRKLARYPWFQG